VKKKVYVFMQIADRVLVSEQIDASIRQQAPGRILPTMDIHSVLSELRVELKELEEVIVVMERLAPAPNQKTRRRPPKLGKLVVPKSPRLVLVKGTKAVPVPFTSSCLDIISETASG
jgi:hypothetical protein